MEPVNYTCFFLDVWDRGLVVPAAHPVVCSSFDNRVHGEWAEQKGRRSSYGVAHLSSAGDWRMG